jgi:hypothetical protein
MAAGAVVMHVLAGRGLLCITDAVAAGIADEQALTELAALRGAVVETELGPAIPLREVERILTGARS